PLVADEIQCGLGRAGSFLYAEQLGVRPDYVLLGKSLGGGLVKVSAVAIACARFIPEFTLQHGSTFAGDGLSSHVATRALRLLDAEDVAAAAGEAGRRLLSRLRALAARHPRAIREVRGRGLMLGLELETTFEGSSFLRYLAQTGWLGYAVAGFLLRGH